MQVIEKPWGVARRIVADDNCEVWHCSIKAGGKSSVHRHNCHNYFHVLSGRLAVTISGKLHIVTSGKGVVAAMGLWHSFDAKTDVELIEIYSLPHDQGAVTIERQGEHAKQLVEA